MNYRSEQLHDLLYHIFKKKHISHSKQRFFKNEAHINTIHGNIDSVYMYICIYMYIYICSVVNMNLVLELGNFL